MPLPPQGGRPCAGCALEAQPASHRHPGPQQLHSFPSTGLTPGLQLGLFYQLTNAKTDLKAGLRLQSLCDRPWRQSLCSLAGEQVGEEDSHYAGSLLTRGSWGGTPLLWFWEMVIKLYISRDP